MYQFSDSESKDSDEGIRFKTDSTRNKTKSDGPDRKRDRSRRSRSRSSPHRSRDSRRRQSREREESRRKSSKSKKYRRDRKQSSSEDSTPSRRKVDDRRRLHHSVTSSEEKKIGNKANIEESNNKKRELETKPVPEKCYTSANSSPKEKKTEVVPVKEDDEVPVKILGPALPPHLVKKKVDCNEVQETPQYIGPQLPPHLLKKQEETDGSHETEQSENSNCIGPSLPPHLLNKSSENIGPQLPSTPQESSRTEDSDDEPYGPVPIGESNNSKAQLALEERALQLKMDQLNPDEDKAAVREEWMLELPEVKASRLGLGPRQFRSKAGPDMSDRSSWTDTPESKKTKKAEVVDLKKEAKLKEIKRRDKEQEAMSKKHKKSKESLLDMHQSKLKKSNKEKEGPSERRPFSRDVDLKVNRFDEAQKKAVLKKAQLLDDRFSRGQSKFL